MHDIKMYGKVMELISESNKDNGTDRACKSLAEKEGLALGKCSECRAELKILRDVRMLKMLK